jgi:hypothetical protein
MSTDLRPEPEGAEGKRLNVLRAFLYFLAALLVLAVIGYILWGTGTTPPNP